MSKFTKILILSIISIFIANLSLGDTIPTPQTLNTKNFQSNNANIQYLSGFLGVPFRIDGAVNEFGNWTLFSKSTKFFKKPGLNCSGFASAVGRFLLHTNFSLAELKYDRLNDSSATGRNQDWDFGLDLILNLTEKSNRKILAPKSQLDNANYSPAGLIGGKSLRGYDIHSSDFDNLISNLKIGKIYFFSISKETKKLPIGILHYHVGVIVLDNQGTVWLYHTTIQKRTHRINLSNVDGLKYFRESFSKPKLGKRMILLVEVDTEK